MLFSSDDSDESLSIRIDNAKVRMIIQWDMMLDTLPEGPAGDKQYKRGLEARVAAEEKILGMFSSTGVYCGTDDGSHAWASARTRIRCLDGYRQWKT
jgi:hypothetical protein